MIGKIPLNIRLTIKPWNELENGCVHSPPNVAALGEGGGLDDLGGHPGVGAGGAHLGGLVPLSGQAEVRDLQRQTLHTFILYGLRQEDCRGRERQDVLKCNEMYRWTLKRSQEVML